MNSRRLARTPVMIQMEAAECGAVALGIILAYYQCYVPIDELRQACGVSRDGSRALNMIKAAKAYGLDAAGAQIDMDGLSEIDYPCIVYWAFNHFVVLEGYTDKHIYINDPASGQRTISHEAFSRSFTGVVLLFEKTDAFKPRGQKERLSDKISHFLSGNYQAFSFILLATLSLVIPGIVLPGLTKVFIDDVLIHNLSGWLIPLLWGLFFTALLRAMLTRIQQIHLSRLQLKLTLKYSSQFIWHIFRLPLLFFSQRLAGDLSSRVLSIDRISNLISIDLSANAIGLMTMLFFGGVLFFYDGALASFGLGIALINAVVLYVISRHIENMSRRMLQELGKLSAFELSGIQAIESIKAAAFEADFFQRWAGYHAKTINSQQKIQLYTQSLSMLPKFLNGMMTLLILGLGGLRIIHGDLTIGGLVAFQSLYASFNEPLMNLLGFGAKLQAIRGDISRLNDVMNHPEAPELQSKDDSDMDNPPPLKGSLEVQNLTFGYSRLEEPMIKDICFSIKPGQRIALVGASGSGKSTLAKLIADLYRPWSGTIHFDNLCYQEISRTQFSKCISFMDQDVFLFEGTMEDNLTLWDPTIPREDIEQAILDTALQEVIRSRPHGDQTKILSQGANFSGGQRQQIELARAILSRPSLLILDEATGAMDALTEHHILENLKKRGCGLLLITHRLSTVKNCDEILVLERGCIVERGTHASLLETGRVYRSLLTEF